MARLVRVLLVLSLLVLTLPLSGARAANPNTSLLAAVSGAVPTAVLSGTARRLGSLSLTRQLHLSFVLASRNPAGLTAALASINDPTSPDYHHFLTAKAYNDRFGPDPSAVRAAIQWLRGQGLQLPAWDGGQILTVSGTVLHVSQALHVSLGRYSIAGSTRFAADHAPLVPQAFSSTVQAIVGLSQPAPAQSVQRFTIRTSTLNSRARAAATATHLATGPGGGYTPADIASGYDFDPIYAAGMHGEHMRVALVELASYQRSDILQYATQFGIAAPTITDVPVDGGNSKEPAQVEATLDIEQLLSGVPAAAIDVYNAPNDSNAQIDAYSAVARSDTANVLSLEWVNCEPGAVAVAGFVEAQHALFKQMALEGISVVSATGDAGAYACADQQMPSLDNQPAVNLPASDPYVLAVGASDLTLALVNGHAAITAESAWSCPAKLGATCSAFGPNGSGSGGGVSVLFRSGDQFGTDLSWQTGVGSSIPVARQLPDVVMSGSFGTTGDHEYSIYYLGAWVRGAGTSSAAPLWAALLALTDQNLLAQGGQALGWVNPIVYRLGSVAQPYPPYHDITTGNNLLYNAGPGWDYASGWGSPDAWNFLRDATTVKMTELTATPLASATPTGAGKQTPSIGTGTPTALRPSATATIGFPTVTPYVVQTRTSPSPTPSTISSCSAAGVGNGTFQTGTLRCWKAAGKPLPSVVHSTHFAGRFSVQLGSSLPGNSSTISITQLLAVPAGSMHPHLHIDYWLQRSVTPEHSSKNGAVRCVSLAQCPAAKLPKLPTLTVRTASGLLLQTTTLSPHRDKAWSGLVVALPMHNGPFSLSFVLPSQPATAAAILKIDSVQLSS